MARPTESDETAPVVEDAPELRRYEISADEKLAGFTEYRDRDSQRIFFHTEIDSAFGGRGLSSILVQAALTDVRSLGKRIVAVCPLVAGYLKKHNDFEDITDPVTPEILAFSTRTLDQTRHHRPLRVAGFAARSPFTASYQTDRSFLTGTASTFEPQVGSLHGKADQWQTRIEQRNWGRQRSRACQVRTQLRRRQRVCLRLRRRRANHWPNGGAHRSLRRSSLPRSPCS